MLFCVIMRPTLSHTRRMQFGSEVPLPYSAGQWQDDVNAVTARLMSIETNDTGFFGSKIKWFYPLEPF
jgi:hypothetical protein